MSACVHQQTQKCSAFFRSLRAYYPSYMLYICMCTSADSKMLRIFSFASRVLSFVYAICLQADIFLLRRIPKAIQSASCKHGTLHDFRNTHIPVHYLSFTAYTCSLLVVYRICLFITCRLPHILRAVLCLQETPMRHRRLLRCGSSCQRNQAGYMLLQSHRRR